LSETSFVLACFLDMFCMTATLIFFGFFAVVVTQTEANHTG